MRHLLGCAVPRFSSQLKKNAVPCIRLVRARVLGEEKGIRARDSAGVTRVATGCAVLFVGGGSLGGRHCGSCGERRGKSMSGMQQ